MPRCAAARVAVARSSPTDCAAQRQIERALAAIAADDRQPATADSNAAHASDDADAAENDAGAVAVAVAVAVVAGVCLRRARVASAPRAGRCRLTASGAS